MVAISLRLVAACALFAAGSFFTNPVRAASPVNDAFTNAFPLVGTYVQWTNNHTFATAETGEPHHCGQVAAQSLWYTWHAPLSGTVVIQPTNKTTIGRCAIYSGSVLTNLSSVASNSVTRIETETIFIASENQDYLIAFDRNLSFSSANGVFGLQLYTKKLASLTNGQILKTGVPFPLSLEGSLENVQEVRFLSGTNLLGAATNSPFEFTWTPQHTGTNQLSAVAINSDGSTDSSLPVKILVAPGNDNFADAYPLPPDLEQMIVSGERLLATAEPGEPRHGQLPPRNSVWWRWTPHESGMASIQHRTGNPTIAIYTGDTLTNLVSVPLEMPMAAVSSFPVQAELEYSIAMDGFSPSLSPFSFELDFTALTMRSKLPKVLKTPVSVPLSLETLPENIQSLQFLDGGDLIGAATNAPFEVIWMPQHTGQHVLSGIITYSDGTTANVWPTTMTVLPGNDNFSDAFVLPPDSSKTVVSGETSFATAEPDEPDHAQWSHRNSLWWSWKPNSQGTATVQNLTGLPVIAVYTGDTLTNLIPIASTMNLTTEEGWFAFPVQSGTEYRIAVDGNNPPPFGAVGFEIDLTTLAFITNSLPANVKIGSQISLTLTNFETDHPLTNAFIYLGTNLFTEIPADGLSFTFTTNQPGDYVFTCVATNNLSEERRTSPVTVRFSPTNDAFVDAIELPSQISQMEPTVVAGTLAFAGNEAGEQLNGSQVGSVWYKWVAPFSAELQYTVEEGAPVPTFYTGDSLATLTSLTNTWENPRFVTAGTSYYISVGAGWGYDMPFQFTLRPPPPNDNFADAIELIGTSGKVTGPLYSASAETGENFTENLFQRSIWYKWTATETGDLSPGTTETLGMRMQITVYAGTSVTNLQTLMGPYISSDLSTSGSGSSSGGALRVRKGSTYYIRVSGIPTSNIYPEVTLSYAFNIIPNIPANDDFDGALVLSSGQNEIQADNSLASTEPGELAPPSSNVSGHSLWWKLTPSDAGTLSVFATGTGFTVSYAVYKGTSLSNLELLGSGSPYPLYVRALKEETYYIQVDSYSGHIGVLNVQARFYPRPANDNFENSTHLEGSSVSVTGNNVSATLQPGEQPVATNSLGKTVWYSWASPGDGEVVVGFPTANFFPVYKIFNGPDLAHLTEVPVEVPLVGNSHVFLAREGVVYHIQLDGLNLGECSLTLTFNKFEPATNDNFSQARVLREFPIDKASVVGATLERGEPAHREGPAKSIWWFWQAPLSGLGSLWPDGSLTEDPVLAVYTGDTLETLQLVAQGRGAFNFPVRGGVIYKIAGAVPLDATGYISITPGQISPSGGNPVSNNLLQEASFEGTALMDFKYWRLGGPIGGYVNERGGADGTTWPSLAGGGKGLMWQDIPTVPGRSYKIEFAYNGDYNFPPVQMTVLWDDVPLGDALADAGESYWHWTNFVVTATKELSQLKFHNLLGNAGLDAVSVVWLNEPPTIINNPKSVTAYMGGIATFSVGAKGLDPLSYQWFFNGAVLTNQTNSTLFLQKLDEAATGEYSVRVTNPVGSVTSAPASLTLEKPSSPRIVVQPEGRILPEGIYYVLSASAIGTPPLYYQWLFNGAEMSGQTNSSIVFPALGTNDAGLYTLRVRNSAGESVLSLPARITVSQSNSGGGLITFGVQFENQGLLPPIRDADGITPLNGGGYVAQLYAGPSLDTLFPASAPVPFWSGFGAGYFEVTGVTLATVPPEATAYVQLRVWEVSNGQSFEEARARGGKFGRSEVLQIKTGSVAGGRTAVQQLTGFHLEAGLPGFNTGKIQATERMSDKIIWTLEGEGGYKYLIEQSGADLAWTPYTIVTNVTGTVTFETATNQSAEPQFFRSRILD
jgi:hypothetical protein